MRDTPWSNRTDMYCIDNYGNHDSQIIGIRTVIDDHRETRFRVVVYHGSRCLDIDRKNRGIGNIVCGFCLPARVRNLG